MAAAQEPELSGALRLTDLRHVLDVVVEQAYRGLRQLAERLPGEADGERCVAWLANFPCCARRCSSVRVFLDTRYAALRHSTHRTAAPLVRYQRAYLPASRRACMAMQSASDGLAQGTACLKASAGRVIYGTLLLGPASQLALYQT